MSNQIKSKIDELSERLNEYNKKVDSLNPTMTSRIDKIVSQPMPGPLNEKYVPGIYHIARAAFEEVILTPESEIEDVFKSHDMQHKVQLNGTGSYGFGGEEHRAINMLNAIETNSQIKQDLQTLRDMVKDIRQLTNDIVSPVSEIIQEIEDKRYHEKHWCCPSLIKELWHYFI